MVRSEERSDIGQASALRWRWGFRLHDRSRAACQRIAPEPGSRSARLALANDVEPAESR